MLVTVGGYYRVVPRVESLDCFVYRLKLRIPVRRIRPLFYFSSGLPTVTQSLQQTPDGRIADLVSLDL